jgi:hypothetical protein
MIKKPLYRVKVTGVEKSKIEIENAVTKKVISSEVDRPKKDVLRLLGVTWLGREGAYTTDVDDISALLTNFRSDEKLQDFCDTVENQI